MLTWVTAVDRCFRAPPTGMGPARPPFGEQSLCTITKPTHATLPASGGWRRLLLQILLKFVAFHPIRRLTSVADAFSRPCCEHPNGEPSESCFDPKFRRDTLYISS